LETFLDGAWEVGREWQTDALEGRERRGEGIPFWKEPASEDDARALVRRGEGTTGMRTLRKWGWSGANRKAE